MLDRFWGKFLFVKNKWWHNRNDILSKYSLRVLEASVNGWRGWSGSWQPLTQGVIYNTNISATSVTPPWDSCRSRLWCQSRVHNKFRPMSRPARGHCWAIAGPLFVWRRPICSSWIPRVHTGGGWNLLITKWRCTKAAESTLSKSP